MINQNMMKNLYMKFNLYYGTAQKAVPCGDIDLNHEMNNKSARRGNADKKLMHS